MKALSGPMVVGPLIFIFILIIGVIIYVYSVSKWGMDSPFGGNNEVARDSIQFSVSDPKVTESQIEEYVDANGGGQLKQMGSEFHRQGRRFDIDPAFAIAVSLVETRLGKERCDTKLTLGTWMGCNNFFCLEFDAEIFDEDLGDKRCENTKYASFSSAERGIEAFFEYISKKFVAARPSQDTISKIGCVPKNFNNCYCSMSGKDCRNWVDNVVKYTLEIRIFRGSD